MSKMKEYAYEVERGRALSPSHPVYHEGSKKPCLHEVDVSEIDRSIASLKGVETRIMDAVIMGVHSGFCFTGCEMKTCPCGCHTS